MEKIVPLAAQSVVGPLGLMHLPRLWLKVVLSAADLLPAGYLDTNIGSNQTIVDAVGLDPDATYAYLKTMPTYMEFEVWVKANAKNLTPASIAASNASIVAQIKPEEKAAVTRAQVGLTDASVNSSDMLNALDDWDTVYKNVLAHRGQPMQTIVPAISSQTAGPLGLQHLPRFWLKATLEGQSRLYDGWKSGPASGFDTWFSGVTGLDNQKALDFIHAELPPYMVFEAWFIENATNISPAQIAEHNAAMAIRVKPDHVAAEERAVLGIDDPNYKLSREINDLIDWHQLHEQITSVRV
jgi:hypothetical protein